MVPGDGQMALCPRKLPRDLEGGLAVMGGPRQGACMCTIA